MSILGRGGGLTYLVRVNLRIVMGLKRKRYVVIGRMSYALRRGRRFSPAMSFFCFSRTCALPASFDVLTFQLLASVVFPGFTINRWVTFVEYMVQTSDLESQVRLAYRSRCCSRCVARCVQTFAM